MIATIITIGDEILIGQIVDTNAACISRALNSVGITVRDRISVGDDAPRIREALDRALAVSTVVIITGGLGPTKDDITKKTLAEYYGNRLVFDPQVADHVQRMLDRRGIAFNELNRSQAMVPACCQVLPNANGTAPGMWFERDGRIAVSLPGVPFEMEHLLEETVLPRLREHFRLSAVVHKTMITYGLAESILAETIAEWEEALPAHLHLAYLPSARNVKLRLSAYDVEREEAQREIDGQFARLEAIIPEYVLGYGDDVSVFRAVHEALIRRKRTLAVAESCTGGALAAEFTALAGASEYFLCGVVSYSNSAKVHVLGVRAEDIERHGAVSREVAEQMAAGVRRIAGADYGVATTGVAGPGGGTERNPVGSVWIAVADAEGVVSAKYTFGRLRDQNIERASAKAADMLRRRLSQREEK